MIAYTGWLKWYAQEFDIQVHAWVLMTNHVHLLLTPGSDQGVSKLIAEVACSASYKGSEYENYRKMFRGWICRSGNRCRRYVGYVS
ncbi:transposase [Microbulbifer agarilyticus]|uniref:transposase n=1 Tax=Microbulbifer agarilyticus TaxID=260552 RepID=UPI001CD7EB95|nr:transposase [Microbulbifer agarilyticus]MCA0901473.1 transposase [Microbulbifer agarilyticus]